MTTRATQTGSEFLLNLDLVTGRLDDAAVPSQVAVIGAGRWGRIVCNVLAQFSPALSRVVVVAERNFAATAQWFDERRGASANGHPEFEIVPSVDAVLDDRDVEVAFVTKMASEHYHVTRELLLAGKHVMVEKPFVLRIAEADDLVRLARSRQRRLAVGYEFMFARTLHHFRHVLDQHAPDIRAVRFVWDDEQGLEKWGVRKQPDLSANVVTDLYPHVLSHLLLLFGRREIELRGLTSRDGCTQAQIDLEYGEIPVTALLDKHAERARRQLIVECSSGQRFALDYTTEPGRIELDGRSVGPDPLATAFPPSLTSQIAYFFAHITRPEVTIPNAAEDTVQLVDATERAAGVLAARQMQELRAWLWRDLPDAVPDASQRIIRHHLLGGLLRHGLVASPKDTDALDLWAAQAFRIVHCFSREPWTEQQKVLEREGLDRQQLVRLNAAIRESDFAQDLMVREGPARQYWSTVLPLIETGSIDAVLSNRYQFPLRVGIYAAVSCMFSCTFCGRMENPSARYAGTDVAPGNAVFDQVFAAMPRGVSTLALGGGLEPLTNPNLDDVIRSAKRHGHKVPLVTNGYMLTPHYVKRHEGLWDVDVLRISLYGVDEDSYYNVTKKRGAFQIVKQNVIDFLKARRDRQGGPRVGFNFIVLVNTTHEVLALIDLIADINRAVGGPGIDFLTLREDFSMREGEGLSADERRNLIAIFQEFIERRQAKCPDLAVDFGYALYPLSRGVFWRGLPMVDYRGMLPKAYPQVSVAMDLLGDVYLYRDAVFPQRPGAVRYRIGTVTAARPLEAIVREFVEHGPDIEAHPNDPWLMDAFDHVVTNLIWQAKADQRAGVPFQDGPVRRRAGRDGGSQGRPAVVNYWQGLFGA